MGRYKHKSNNGADSADSAEGQENGDLHDELPRWDDIDVDDTAQASGNPTDNVDTANLPLDDNPGQIASCVAHTQTLIQMLGIAGLLTHHFDPTRPFQPQKQQSLDHFFSRCPWIVPYDKNDDGYELVTPPQVVERKSSCDFTASSAEGNMTVVVQLLGRDTDTDDYNIDIAYPAQVEAEMDEGHPDSRFRIPSLRLPALPAFVDLTRKGRDQANPSGTLFCLRVTTADGSVLSEKLVYLRSYRSCTRPSSLKPKNDCAFKHDPALSSAKKQRAVATKSNRARARISTSPTKLANPVDALTGLLRGEEGLPLDLSFNDLGDLPGVAEDIVGASDLLMSSTSGDESFTPSSGSSRSSDASAVLFNGAAALPSSEVPEGVQRLLQFQNRLRGIAGLSAADFTLDLCRELVALMDEILSIVRLSRYGSIRLFDLYEASTRVNVDIITAMLSLRNSADPNVYGAVYAWMMYISARFTPTTAMQAIETLELFRLRRKQLFDAVMQAWSV